MPTVHFKLCGALYNTVGWAIYTYYHRKGAMEKMIKHAMSKRLTWEESANKYVETYKQAIRQKIGEERY